MAQESTQPTGKKSEAKGKPQTKAKKTPRRKHILLTRIQLESDVPATIVFDDKEYEVGFSKSTIKVSTDPENFVTLTQLNQKLPTKGRTIGSFVLSEEKQGKIDYKDEFTLHWDEDSFVPELEFKKPPVKVSRRYTKGQSIELGIEDVTGYQLQYQDGVEAWFTRQENKGFSFKFSTGFYGSFSKEKDDSYTLKFKGNRLKPGENAYRSQSKFVVSRSKYTGNLLLFVQEDAVVELT